MQDLKGKPLQDLQWHLGEEVVIEPFYHAEDVKEKRPPILGQRQSNSWEIGEEIEVKIIKEANRHALNALEQGVTALRFVLHQSCTEADLKNLLNDIQLDIISTHFCERFEKSDSQPVDVLKKFYDIVTKRLHDGAQIQGSLNLDSALEENLEQLQEVLAFAVAYLPAFKVLTVNTHRYYGGAAETSAELAQTIAKANSYLRQFSERGFSIQQLNQHLQFSVSIGTSYFVEIAKLRALRLLWANVLQAYGVTQVELPPIEVHFASQSQSENRYDNMIRATTQALSAVVGGANRLTVLPSNALQEEPTAFTYRIARNVQHILQLESQLDRVIDPAAGSYFVEQLTEKLAEEAWRKFQEM